MKGNRRWAVTGVVFGFLAIPVQGQLGFGDLSFAETHTYAGAGGGAYYNGADGAGGFGTGGLFFPNTFTDFGGGFTAWEGWAWSTTGDTSTPGFANQYSAITGAGRGDDAYLMGYTGGSEPLAVHVSPGQRVLSAWVTNSTYAALSMRHGDAFAKKFGDDPATPEIVETDFPDTYQLTVEGFDDAENSTGMLEFYLADYRFSSDGDDVIVEEWARLDLTPLGDAVAKLTFSLSSTDNGSFGMNTPAYFALDDITVIPEPAMAPYAVSLGAVLLLWLRRRRRDG